MRVRFVIRKNRINQIGTCPLNCRITIDGIKTNEFAIGVSVDPNKWDSKVQRMKGANAKAVEVNKLIEIVKSELDEIYLSARAVGKKLSAYEVKNIYTGVTDLSISISKLGEKYIDELTIKERAKATLIRYRRCFKYLTEYLKNDMGAESIERRHVSSFWIWLKSKKFHNDYCNKIVQACNGLFRFGLREGYVQKNPFEGFSLEWKKELDTTYVSNEEINKIKNYKWGVRLQRVADSFLFMCYTGLHISDYIGVEKLTEYEVEEEEDGVMVKRRWMKYNRVKTGIESKFPVHSYVKFLLIKYGGLSGMPRISAQKSNDYLKLIASATGITKNLTNKIARKTFTNMAINDFNMDFENVATMLGHTSTRQIKHYGTVSEKRIMSQWGDK